MKLHGRQGDVVFVTCKIPHDAKRIPLRTFALGESTGHSHRVAVEAEPFVEMYEKDGQIFVRALADAPNDVPIVHEDHDPSGSISLLPKGWEGEVRIKREYDEEKDFRPVID